MRWIKKYGALVAFIFLLGIAAGAAGVVFLGEDKDARSFPFISERVLFNPPPSAFNMPAPNEDDHVWGDLDAPVVAVEYSDLECPYCKRHHFVMQRIVNHYQGEVAWVYRHRPLTHRFSQSRIEAAASECVAELGNNAAFWRFITDIFETTTSNDGLDLALLPNFAQKVGVDRSAFQNCMDEGRTLDEVDKDFQDSAAAGLSYTPSMIILWGDDQRSLVIGSQRYETLIDIFDLLLGRKSAEELEDVTDPTDGAFSS